MLALRSNAKRIGAGCFPLPGIGAWVQLSLHECPNARAGAATVVAIPVLSLVEAGLTILADLHTFACTESGSKVIRESAVVATLHSERQLLWLPYGFFPFVVAREPETDESSNKLCHASLWVKTVFHPSLCRAVSHPVWTPINNMNIEHLQHLSGQKLWQSRKVTYEKLTAERAALMLQFEDTSTGGGQQPPAEAASRVGDELIPIPDSNQPVRKRSRIVANAKAKGKAAAAAVATASEDLSDS